MMEEFAKIHKWFIRLYRRFCSALCCSPINPTTQTKLGNQLHHEDQTFTLLRQAAITESFKYDCSIASPISYTPVNQGGFWQNCFQILSCFPGLKECLRFLFLGNISCKFPSRLSSVLSTVHSQMETQLQWWLSNFEMFFFLFANSFIIFLFTQGFLHHYKHQWNFKTHLFLSAVLSFTKY